MTQTSDKSLEEVILFLEVIGETPDYIWLRFWDWHLQHPDVATKLRDLAIKAKQAGQKKWGIGAIWEVLRWHLRVEHGETHEFRCSNDYRSRYARFLMWKYPELRGFFVLRELRTGKVGV
jgi:hypothetical protein